jgi:hypothetical protein
MLRETSSLIAAARNAVVAAGGTVTTALSATRCIVADNLHLGTQVGSLAAHVRRPARLYRIVPDGIDYSRQLSMLHSA